MKKTVDGVCFYFGHNNFAHMSKGDKKPNSVMFCTSDREIVGMGGKNVEMVITDDIRKQAWDTIAQKLNSLVFLEIEHCRPFSCFKSISTR